MSNVELTIGGRTYTVATSPGDEERIRNLGALVDDKVRALGPMAGQSETRQLLFAALFLADELEQQRFNSPPSAAAAAPAADAEMADALESLAARLESLVAALEDRA